MRNTLTSGWTAKREAAWLRIFTAPAASLVDDCPYCGAKDVGPEHHGYAPSLCKES